MKKLNEQWIEVIDGQEHMMKAVKSFDGKSCNTCIYFGDMRCEYKQKHNVSSCPTGGSRIEPNDIIVKDLGILNEEGCLPDERTGLYPRIEEAKDNVQVFKWSCIVSSDNVYIRAHGSTKQKAIDAWNRRV